MDVRNELPLSDLVVLDLTVARAGPTAVRQLADWGAEVIRIEPAGAHDDVTGGRRHGSDFQNLHRNKRCITLDLKQPRGREIFLRAGARAPTSWSRTSAPTSSTASASTTTRCARSTRASSTAASRDSGRTVRTAIAPASIRSRRVSAA